MTNEKPLVLTGVILEEEVSLTLEDLCQACAVDAEFIVALVEEGALNPSGPDRGPWRFSGRSLSRTRTALRLRRDLEINVAGVALTLELLDEIMALRAGLQD